MSTTPNKLTETFNKQVNSLIEGGIVANFTEIVRALDWNKSMMTEVTKGRKNVPMAVYRKFTEYYKLRQPVVESEVNEESSPRYVNKDEHIEALKLNVALLQEQLNSATGELRHIAVTNYAMLRAIMEPVAQLLAKAEKIGVVEAKQKINKVTASTYRTVREKGSFVGLDI